MKRQRKISFRYFAVCLTVCVSLLLTACGKDSAAGDNGEAGSREAERQGTGGSESGDSIAPGTPGREWVYVPEVITVGDSRADYDGMGLVGDEICYISMSGEAEDEAQKICRYSLTDRELDRLDIQWPLEEKRLEICSYVFAPDYSVWLIVNAYSADYGQLKRYLCRFDSEGKNLFYQNVTEEMGRGSYVGDMVLDGQGRIYVLPVSMRRERKRESGCIRRREAIRESCPSVFRKQLWFGER